MVLSESGAVPTDRRTAERRIMQVASSVNSRYYAQYHSSSSAKKSADTSAFAGNYVSNEAVEYQRSAKVVDYQEYYKAWMSQENDRVIEFVNGNASVNSMEQTEVVSIAETEDGGEFLGLTMVPEEGQSVTYGMRAMLSEKSTPDNPIVQVVSNLGGKKVIYNVEVNKVDPNNATQLEMFALLSYTDKMGITDGGTFGSHQQLEVYGGNASSIGYCGSLSGADVFLNERFDWTAIMEKMVQVYKDAGIENQAEDCKVLFDFFATYTENDEVKDNTAIDFSRFAPNAPEKVKQAFMEAAEETGYNEGERMDYLSQVFIHQVENRQNGVADYTDVFGGSIASALQVAREILYDLENPLMPISQRGENAAKYIEQEKQFYRAFIEKLEGLTGADNIDTEETVDYAKILEEKINEIFAKIQNGDTEASYQIGSQSFTEKEWEEFLDKFDTIEEAIQELMKEEQARKEAKEAQKEDVVTNDASTLLTTESTSCVYETADPDDDDIRYITWYTEEGIFCRKAGQAEGYEWAITFENTEQYDKVMEFIGQFPSDWNMRFAAHENFWNDFLNDEIDMEGFMEFINGTNKGVPNFSITVGDSMYVDADKAQWAKYTNPLGSRFYTAEEMHQMQMEIIAANEEKLKAQQVSYEEMYKRTHPDYNGERIFRTISGGQLYTANEIDELLYQEMLERMGVTEEEMQQRRDEWRKQMGYPGY